MSGYPNRTKFDMSKNRQKYLNEFDFRFNSRFIADSSRFEYYLTNNSKKLSYKQLIKA